MGRADLLGNTHPLNQPTLLLTNLLSATEKGRSRDLAALAIYVAAVAILLWPLWPKFTSRLPMGSEETRTVPLFNQWTISWNALAVQQSWHDYWNARIFYPDANTFAYSEPQPLTMLLAPLAWWGSATLAYNFYVAVSLLLNGCATHLLLRWLGYNWLPTVVGSAMMIALPIVHWQLGVSQLVPIWGVLWSLWAFAKIQKQSLERTTPLLLNGVELGGAMAITSWMAIYHALFLTTLLGVCVWFMGKRLWQANVLRSLTVAVVVCVALTSPMIRPLWLVSSNDEFIRPAEMVEKLSLVPQDYLSIWGTSPWSGCYYATDRYWRMNPGWLKVLLAGVAMCVGLRAVGSRQWIALLCVFVVSAFLFSMGLHLQLGTWSVWECMTSVLPGFEQVRSPFRYGYFVQIGILLGAAGGVQTLWSWAAHRPGRISKNVARLMTVGIALFALIDPWPHTLKLGVVPDLRAAENWCQALQDAHRAAPGAALCLPMAGGEEARDFEKTCEWMLLGLQHGVPLVNGYSGFCPQRLLDLGAELVEQPMTAQRLAYLHTEGVRYLIVERDLFKLPWHAGQPIESLQLRLIATSSNGIDVYSIEPL